MNNKLDSKTLLEDNAQLWHYGLQSFKSGDTQFVRLESKLYFRNSKNYIRLRIDLEFDLVRQKLMLQGKNPKELLVLSDTTLHDNKPRKKEHLQKQLI